jgi:hypothetical protein
MTSKEDITKLEESMTEVITDLMNKHFPGWDKKTDEFKTFQDYCNWVERCIDSIIILPEDSRSDH